MVPYSFNIKKLEKTQNLPRRFKLTISKNNKTNNYTLEEWQVRSLIGILDNSI